MSLIIVTPILPLLIIIISYFRMPWILTGPGGHHRLSAVNLLHISLPCRRLCHDLWEWRLTPSVTHQHNVCFVWATPSEVFSMHSSPPCGRKGESTAAGDKLISTPFSPHILHPPPTTSTRHLPHSCHPNNNPLASHSCVFPFSHLFLNELRTSQILKFLLISFPQSTHSSFFPVMIFIFIFVGFWLFSFSSGSFSTNPTFRLLLYLE